MKRALIVVGKSYSNRPGFIEPMFFELFGTLTQLGWDVQHFDHFSVTREHGSTVCAERFEASALAQDFDLILYQTAGQDRMDREALANVSRRRMLVAWNSDDDWQWDSYTSKIAGLFTFMVTTYDGIYERNRSQFPNLLLSQWACYPAFADHSVEKDIDFSFAGYIYGDRLHECRQLRKKAGLKTFGLGSGLVRYGLPRMRGIGRFEFMYGAPMRFEEINQIWNRTRISFTPMGASVDPALLQIKSRTFEMGLSGTLMLCNASPYLERYYLPGEECVTFETLEDCAEKARYYLTHETQRRQIAQRYRLRTLKSHLWTTRMSGLLKQFGIQ